MKNFFFLLFKRLYEIDILELIDEKKRLQGENRNILAEVESLQKERKEVQNKLKRAQSTAKSTASELAEAISTTKQLEVALAKSEETNRQMQEALTSSGQELQRANEEVERLKAEIVSKDAEISQLRDTSEEVGSNEAQDQIENLTRGKEELEKKIKELEEKNKKLKKELGERISTIGVLNERLNEFSTSADGDGTTTHTQEPENSITEDMESTIDLNENSQIAFLPDGKFIPIEEIDNTKRTIDVVLDLEDDKDVYASRFFALNESYLFKMRTELERSIFLRKPRFVCKYCGQPVRISGRKTERGFARFFSHLRDSDDCDYKTTTGRTKREIEREKYARCNEGERHKKLKQEIARLLSMTEGVSDVAIEKTIKGNHPILRWRRPDVYARYKGEDIVFELQLSTTFVSVIAERDMFYRQNQTHIVWIFNFEEHAEHVDLTNMMTKDIYYNNRLNIFIFDRASQEESMQRGELVLKCNWINAEGHWQYENGNTSDDIGGKFITLSDLNFNRAYKPYYQDFESVYYSRFTDLKASKEDIEAQNKKELELLDLLWQEEQKREEEAQRKTDDLRKILSEEYEIKIDEKRSTKKFLIGERNGKYGLLTYDGAIRIPFEYNKLESHRAWFEGLKQEGVDIFDSDYNIIDTYGRLVKLDKLYCKYVKKVGDNWLWGLLELKQGRAISQPFYSQIDTWADNKLLAIRDGLYCIIDEDGKEIISGYDFIGTLENNQAEIRKDGSHGLIDETCKAIITDEINIGDYTKVCQIDHWGIRREDGTMLVDCIYDELGSLRESLVGVNGSNISLVFQEGFHSDCPVKVEYVEKNERKMLIFKVGKREAFMNLRQQQKVIRKGLDPMELKAMFISHVNLERNLLYLSATPVHGPILRNVNPVRNTDISVGSVVDGIIVHIDDCGFIFKTKNEQTYYVHKSMWGEFNSNSFKKGDRVKALKVAYDYQHHKHVWSILSIQDSGHE